MTNENQENQKEEEIAATLEFQTLSRAINAMLRETGEEGASLLDKTWARKWLCLDREPSIWEKVFPPRLSYIRVCKVLGVTDWRTLRTNINTLISLVEELRILDLWTYPPKTPTEKPDPWTI